MANGANTTIFQPKRKRNTRKNLYEAILGQKANAEDFLLDQPDWPEMDSERRKKLKRLSTVSAVAQGINALTDAIGVGTSENYVPAQTGMSELGVTSFEELARMDQGHRNRLDQWKQNVLNTRRANKQTRSQIAGQNAQVDLQAAQQKYKDYMNDSEANRVAEERKAQLERETKLRRQRAWKEAGLRLISQGQEKAGVAALGRGGLSTEEIATMLAGRTSEGPEGSKADSDPEILKRRNMVEKYHSLLDKIEGEDANKHYAANGDAKSQSARQLEWIQNELGSDLFHPQYQPQQPQKTTAGSPAEISPSNRRRMESGLDPEKVRAGLRSPESVASENRELVLKIKGSDSIQEQRKLAGQLIQNWREFGMTDQEVERGMDRLFEQSSGSSQAAVNSVDREPPTFEEFKEQLNQERMGEFSEQGAQRREQLMNMLQRLNSGATKLREIITSPLWALKQAYNNLEESRQKALYEKYQQSLKDQQELAEN